MLYVTHAKSTLLTTWAIVTCIGMSAESIIALCLLAQLFKTYAKDSLVSEVPGTIMHASAMS